MGTGWLLCSFSKVDSMQKYHISVSFLGVGGGGGGGDFCLAFQCFLDAAISQFIFWGCGGG